MFGLLAGVLAAATILPTAIPLTSQLREGESRLALQSATSAAHLAAWQVGPDGSLLAGAAEQLGVESVRVARKDGVEVFHDGGSAPIPLEEVCRAPTRGIVRPGDGGGDTWCAACVSASDRYDVVATVRVKQGSATLVGYFVVVLAVAVAMITALGVLRLLAPLGNLTRAIGRVSGGERGVRFPGTGLAELDELVDEVNALARASEEREDAIKARIQVVQQLARMVAHEVRNPLQSLELLATLVQDESDPEERRRIASSIREEIRALNAVVQRLLRGDPQRALQVQREKRALAPLVQQVVALHRPVARERGLKLLANVSDAVTADVDATLVRRSIENLVVNALQAVEDEKGRVEVTLVEEDPEWVCIEVDDNGPGIAPEMEGRMYDVDVTNKPHGTGLGLALVKGVIEAHGGTIAHDRSPLGGARFRARLPVHAVEVP